MTARPTGAAPRAVRILAVAAAIHVLLFAAHTAGAYQSRARAVPDPMCERGAGVVIRSDGLGYYAWLRSSLIDGDWRFENEFDDLNPLGVVSGRVAGETPTGRRINPWSVGPACVWSVAVVPCHALVRTTGISVADGYSLPYQLAVGGTTLALALLTLGLLYRICCHFADPLAAATGAAFATLGTTLLYYATVEPSMGHVPAAAALAGYMWFWLRRFGEPTARRWFVLGALLGLTALMRWQLAVYGLLVIGEWVWLFAHGANRFPLGRLAVLALASATGGVVAVLPQLIAWKVVYGSWLVATSSLASNWSAPRLSTVLFAADRGFFYWTPMALLAAAGLVLAARGPSARRAQVLLLFLAAAVQVYALAAIRVYPTPVGEHADLGSAFGFRLLTETCVALAPGLAAMLAVPRLRPWVAAAGCALVAWNLFLIGAYRHLIVPPDAGADVPALLAAVVKYARWRATEFPLLVCLPALVLTAVVFTARPRAEGAVVSASAVPARRAA